MLWGTSATADTTLLFSDLIKKKFIVHLGGTLGTLADWDSPHGLHGLPCIGMDNDQPPTRSFPYLVVARVPTVRLRPDSAHLGTKQYQQRCNMSCPFQITFPENGSVHDE